MTQPTKADLTAAVARLTEENSVLYDLFAAIRDGATDHNELPWIIGYAGGIGETDFERGNVRLLRAHARNLRRGPGCHAEHEEYRCDLRGGHNPARHEVHGDNGELIAAWDPAPVLDVKAPALAVDWCPATTGPDEELDRALYCDREAGHTGSHHAPGPDEGSEVAWSDAPAQEHGYVTPAMAERRDKAAAEYADRHADLDPGELGSMSDAEFCDRTAASAS